MKLPHSERHGRAKTARLCPPSVPFLDGKTCHFPAFFNTQLSKDLTNSVLRENIKKPQENSGFSGGSGGDKNGSGARTRTADTWIMIPAADCCKAQLDNNLHTDISTPSPYMSPSFPETSPEEAITDGPEPCPMDALTAAFEYPLGLGETPTAEPPLRWWTLDWEECTASSSVS